MFTSSFAQKCSKAYSEQAPRTGRNLEGVAMPNVFMETTFPGAQSRIKMMMAIKALSRNRQNSRTKNEKLCPIVVVRIPTCLFVTFLKRMTLDG